MKRLIIIFTILTALSLMISTSLFSADKENKKKGEICISFNELPAARGFLDVDRDAVNYLLLQALKKYEVPAAGFVVGDQIEGAFDLLGQWLNAGHTLGSQTFTNQDYHQTEIELFISDIKSGSEAMEVMLSGFGQKKRYFRFPFQHYGNTVDKKEQTILFLDEKNYEIAHTSVLIDDYLYNLTLEKMGKEPDSALFENLMIEYINHVLDEIEVAETLAKQIKNRPCRHILTLRANRLNAVYLDEMLGAIANMGYKFVSLDRALKDKLYQKPEAYFGNRGVSYLKMILESDPDHLPAE